jgi:exosortase
MLTIQKPTLRAVGKEAVPPDPSWAAAGAVTVLVLAHLPMLALQARLTWDYPHYRFFPLAVLGAGVLAARPARRLGPLVPGSGGRAVCSLGGSWALLAVACLIGSPWLGTVAALGAAAAVAYSVGGGRLARALLPAWGLLVLALPPPVRLDGQLIGLLQAAATRCSSRVLDLMGVFHLREGNVIRLADRPLLVEEACSGVHSLFAVLCGTIFLAAWTRRSIGRGVALVTAAVGWVFLANILRIVTVVVVAERWKVDLSSGWAHQALGLAVFGLALGLTASTESLVSLLAVVRGLRRVRERELMMGTLAAPPAPGPDRPPPSPTLLPDLRRTRLASWPVLAAYGSLLLAQPVLLGDLLQDYFVPGSVLASRLMAVRAGDLPGSWGDFRQQGLQTVRRDFSHASGRFSQVWTYRWGGRTVTVSLDGPFLGWHELTSCYLGQGWACRERSVRPREGPGEAVAVARLERPPELKGDLLFSLFDDRGRVLEPGILFGQAGYVFERLSFWRRQWGHRTYQVQLLVEGRAPLTPDEQGQALAFFEQVRSQLIQRLSPSGRGVSS